MASAASPTDEAREAVREVGRKRNAICFATTSLKDTFAGGKDEEERRILLLQGVFERDYYSSCSAQNALEPRKT